MSDQNIDNILNDLGGKKPSSRYRESINDETEIGKYLMKEDDPFDFNTFSMSDDEKYNDIFSKDKKNDLIATKDKKSDEILPKRESSNYDVDYTNKSSRSGSRNPSFSSRNINNIKSNPYENPLCKPVIKVGNTTIGLSQAKLFGLVDNNGNPIKNQKSNKNDKKDISQLRSKLENLSKPRDLEQITKEIGQNMEEERELTFKPGRSQEALRAMRNKRCGYDFIDRLGNRGDFLDRVDNQISNKKGGNKIPQWKLDQMMADYDASLNKLQCPVCKKPQSFDEFIEKKRSCGKCKKRFEKLNVTSGISFAKKVQEHEIERLKKLKKIEIQMYGEVKESQVQDKFVTINSSKNGDTKKLNKTQVRPASAPKRIATKLNNTDNLAYNPSFKRNIIKEKGDSSNLKDKSKKSSRSLNQDHEHLIINNSSQYPPSESVLRIINHNNQHAELLDDHVKKMNGNYSNNKNRPPVHKDPRAKNLSSKFQRLVDI